MRLPVVNCEHWKPSKVYGAGDCAAGVKLRPSIGSCLKCVSRAPNSPSCAAADAPWPPAESCIPPDAHQAPREEMATVAVYTGRGIVRETRKRPTLTQLAAWAVAATQGRYAAPAVVAEREAVCRACPLLRADDKGTWCGACGCSISFEAARLKNLAAYEENIEGLPGHNPAWPAWGCKHPQRGQPVNPAAPNGPRWGWPV